MCVGGGRECVCVRGEGEGERENNLNMDQGDIRLSPSKKGYCGCP